MSGTRNPPEDIIEKLNRLQANHRLAIHVAEATGRFEFPKFSWGRFTAVAPEEIPHRLREPDYPVISMSLIPDRLSGKLMQPYEVRENRLCNLAYMVNLDQAQPSPPRVVRAYEHSLVSGIGDVDPKVLQLTKFRSAYRPLDDIYLPYQTEQGEQDIRAAVANDENGDLTSRQLDALGNYYHDGINLPKGFGRDIEPYNEIIAAAGKAHIAALCVPRFIQENEYHHLKHPEKYKDLQRLLGALGGLEHIRRGLDVPVVYYHVNKPLEAGDPEGNSFTFLGQGKKQLTEIALQTIERLQKERLSTPHAIQGNFSFRYQDLKTSVKDVLGIDMSKPLAEQKNIINALLSKLPSATELDGKQ